jgi:hypothetical protein
VWTYLVDLRSIAHWDPSVEEIKLVAGDPLVAGARYQLEVGFLGNRVSLPYVTVAAERPRRVVFAAETNSVAVRDEARIRPLPDGGTFVTWDADLRLKGARRLFDPLLRLAFARLSRRAARGLNRQLNDLSASGSLEEARA